MAQKLLKASAIINLIKLALVIFGILSLGSIFAVIGIAIMLIPGILMIVSSILFFSYSSMNNEELKKHKTPILIWGIVLIFTSIISGILTLISYTEINNVKEKIETQDDAKKEEPINKELKRLDTLMKLGVGLVALSGIMFATSSWNILSGTVKAIGLLLFSILFFILSNFVGKKLNIKKSEVTYYILGICFFMFSLIALGYFNVLGEWLSFIGNGCNLYMAIMFVILTCIFIISLKKYNQLKLLYLIYASSILVMTYVFLQVGVELKFILLVLAVLALALSLNRNEVNIYTKILNDFGRILIAIVFVALFMIIEIENYIWINIITGSLLIIASYIQGILKNNYLYKIISPILTILFGCYVIYLLNLSFELTLLIATLIITIVYLIAYIRRNNEELFEATFWTTAFAFLYYYLLSISHESFIITCLISAILILLNVINMLRNSQHRSVLEEYSQPVKLLLFINAISLLISSYVNNLDGNVLLLSIGVVFILGYFIQNNIKIKNIYYIGSLVAVLFYYFDILSMRSLPSSFIAGIVNILSISVLTGIAFKSNNDYKTKIKEILFVITSIITFYNIVAITLNYNILLLGILISIILFALLAILLVSNRYLFGTSLIMIGFAINLLTQNVLNVSEDINIIVNNLVSFGIVFVFMHAVLGNANERLKNILETIALSIVFLSVIFAESWIIGIYIGILCIVFIIKGCNSKFTAYFYTGIGFLILNILVQFKNYWNNIPSWAYILIGGLILVGIVTYKEYRNIKPKIKEVKEEKEEKEEIHEEEKPLKTISGEVVIVALLILVSAFSIVDDLYYKVEDTRAEIHEMDIDI